MDQHHSGQKMWTRLTGVDCQCLAIFFQRRAVFFLIREGLPEQCVNVRGVGVFTTQILEPPNAFRVIASFHQGRCIRVSQSGIFVDLLGNHLQCLRRLAEILRAKEAQSQRSTSANVFRMLFQDTTKRGDCLVKLIGIERGHACVAVKGVE